MSYHRFIGLVFLGAFIVVASVCGLLFAYDPLQFWHKPWLRPNGFSKEMRQQIKGMILHYDFDSVIMGDSMTLNVPADYLDYKVGGKWINLSASGTSITEKYVFLKYLFRHKKIKAVYNGFGPHIDDEPDMSEFDFLYDENPFNDMKYYINRKFITCALEWSSKTKCYFKKELKTFTNVMNDYNITRRFGGFLHWFDSKEEMQKRLTYLEKISKQKFELKPFSGSLQKDQKMINEKVFSLVAAHPETKFYFVIPSFSIYHYRTMPPQDYSKWEAILRWFILESQKYPNVSIYSAGNTDYVKDLAHYTDSVHHDMLMNVQQVDLIAKHQTLNAKNMDSYFRSLQQSIQDYDFNPLIHQLKEAIKPL